MDNPTKTALATAIIKVATDANATSDRTHERELAVEPAVTFYIPFTAQNNSVIGVLKPPVSVRVHTPLYRHCVQSASIEYASLEQLLVDRDAAVGSPSPHFYARPVDNGSVAVVLVYGNNVVPLKPVYHLSMDTYDKTTLDR